MSSFGVLHHANRGVAQDLRARVPKDQMVRARFRSPHAIASLALLFCVWDCEARDEVERHEDPVDAGEETPADASDASRPDAQDAGPILDAMPFDSGPHDSGTDDGCNAICD